MRVVTLKQYPIGMISPEEFEIIEKEIPEIVNGQALIENIYCSTDPYLRGRMLPPRFTTDSGRFASIEPGEVIQNETIGRVVSSNISDLSEGDYVLHMGGWAEFKKVITFFTWVDGLNFQLSKRIVFIGLLKSIILKT